jgi:uncharacterized protein YdeI (YjbR/CyaY-like superfamily)
LKPQFFRSPEAFRAWLGKNHAGRSEVWVGFYKVHTGKQGLSYAQALDEALCFGWIDTTVRRIDDERHMQRFTPRKPNSYWSAINTAKAKALIRQGRMAPPGLAAFQARDAAWTSRYAHERASAKLSATEERAFRASGKAWGKFQAMAPSYRKAAIHWVASAKKPATRARRLATLVTSSADGERVPPLTPSKQP